MTRNSGTSPWVQLTAVFAIGMMVGAFSAVQVAPRITTTAVVGSEGAAGTVDFDPTYGDQGFLGDDDQGSVGKGQQGIPTIGPTGGPRLSPPPGLTCTRAGNGGNPGNAKGVSADRIKLATTTVQSGSGASFLGEVKYGMEAVVNKVNRAGGICGRLLEVRFVDDGWKADRGHNAIRNFIEEDIFAIPVGPSSEGLNQAIVSGDINKAGIPVVGADGMVISQYGSPWVWPVAVATVSTARIMARHAYKRGARNFSIVFDRDYKFGQEAALAYNNEVKRLTGKDVDGYNIQNTCQRSYCGIQNGRSSYATEVHGFEPGEFVAMFLEPGTAHTWMNAPNSPKPSTHAITHGIGAAQPMFVKSFADDCKAACHGMWIWRAYRPPIDPYKNEKAVRDFESDLERTKPGADKYNAFTEGGYTGMLLLVEALRRTGPYLTREALQANLNAMLFEPGLTIQPGLRWPPPVKFANTTMRAFEIQYVTTFNGWKARDIYRDDTPQLGVK